MANGTTTQNARDLKFIVSSHSSALLRHRSTNQLFDESDRIPAGSSSSLDSKYEGNSDIDTQNQPNAILFAVVMGISFTVLACMVFMICAARWDRWITKKCAGRKVYITQHFNQDGSSHLSEIIMRRGSSQVSVESDRSNESSVSSTPVSLKTCTYQSNDVFSGR